MMKIAILVSLLIAQVLSKALVDKDDVSGSGDVEQADKRISMPVDKEEDDFSGSGDVEQADKRILMPGTKWCGMGNKAENDDDLGTYVEPDKCCRAHDKCPRKVNGFSKDYQYRNWLPFTVNDCECDGKFYDCMKGVKTHTGAAKIVGKLFFNILSMPCLKFDADGTKATKGSSPSY